MRMLSVRVRYGAPESTIGFRNFPIVLKNSKFGLACTKAGEVPLQGTCGEFDSLRVHKYKTSIKEIYLSCRFCKKYVIDASVRSNLIVHFPMKVKESVEVESGADIFCSCSSVVEQ